MKFGFLIIAFSLFASIALGQEVLTLQVCLDKVKSNSLQTASESGLVNSSKINRQFHWWSLLPNLSVNAGINTSFGRRLDPFTNTFASSSVNSQSFGLNSSVQLFSGFTYFYKQNTLNVTIQRDEIGLNKKLNELKIQAIGSYISLCKLSVQIQLAESRIEKHNQIQEIQRLLMKEGRMNVIDTLKSYNALLGEQDLLLNLNNESKLKMIELNFQMGLPLRTSYEIDLTSISTIEDKPKFSETFQSQLIEAELELLENQLKSKRSEILPTISLNGLVGTGFSTNNKDYLLAGTPTKSYSDQINQNLYEGIGFYLNIPLFNRGEWLKTKQLNAIQQTELANRKELANLLLDKQLLEQEQKQLNIKAQLEQCKLGAANLQMIYNKSLALYKEGRLTYTEMETALMEWQLKLIDYELLKMDFQILKLYE